GPHDGDAGIRKDAAMVADMREKCGEDFWLMLDCWMSQDVAKCRRTGGHMMAMRGSAKMPLWSRICVKNAVRISG
ncbi:hypothetical protein CQA88_31955, partial [Klebsiella pneumoniae]